MFVRRQHLSEILQRLDLLEAKLDQQVLDYQMLYEKARVMLSRLARREQEERREPNESDGSPTPSLDPVSARILNRRLRLGLPPKVDAKRSG